MMMRERDGSGGGQWRMCVCVEGGLTAQFSLRSRCSSLFLSQAGLKVVMDTGISVNVELAG